MEKFKNISSLDVEPFTEKRNGFSYLPWTKCLSILRDNGHSVHYHAGPTENHRFNKEGDVTCTVHVDVFIDGERFSIAYPVADGESVVLNPSAMHIHWAQQRAFVKCVAISTGLGLSLWEKGEPDLAKEPGSLGMDIVSMFGQLVPRFGTPEKLMEHLGFSEKQLCETVKSGSATEQGQVLARIKKEFEDDI